MSRPNLGEVANWDQIHAVSLSADHQQAFKMRQAAVKAVAAGYTIADAARRYELHPRTLTKTLTKAIEVAPDGRPWGWRACVPYKVRSNAVPTGSLESLPQKALPGAFGRLLHLVPPLEKILLDYAGALPKRYQPIPAFEKMFERWKACAKKLVPDGHYPLIAPDLGRRSCLEFIKTQRCGSPFVDVGFEVADAIEAAQLGQVFDNPPGLWTQYDGHAMDCEFWIEGEGPDGKPYLQRITRVWLLIGIDVGSRLIVSWKLSFATNYSGLDFNRTCAQSLIDWEQRDLIVPSMHYVHGSGIGTRVATGFTATGSITSLDNAMAHRLHVNRTQLSQQLLGVINFGRAHVPEARACIEAWFKRIEECAIRHLPGGYRPGNPGSEGKISTSAELGKDYPVVVEAARDLMDVILSGYNATEIAAHQNRSPLDVTRSHALGGGWMFATSNHFERATNLSHDSVSVTIRGSRLKKRQPFVLFKYARYRSSSLKGRWELIGNKFTAVYDTNDMRCLSLYDEKGDLFVILRALSPWSQTRHDLDLRKIIHRAVKQGKFEIKGAKCAIAAYLSYLRSIFLEHQSAAGELARFESIFNEIEGQETSVLIQMDHQDQSAYGEARTVAPSKLYVPLSGPVSLGKRKVG